MEARENGYEGNFCLSKWRNECCVTLNWHRTAKGFKWKMLVTVWVSWEHTQNRQKRKPAQLRKWGKTDISKREGPVLHPSQFQMYSACWLKAIAKPKTAKQRRVLHVVGRCLSGLSRRKWSSLQAWVSLVVCIRKVEIKGMWAQPKLQLSLHKTSAVDVCIDKKKISICFVLIYK